MTEYPDITVKDGRLVVGGVAIKVHLHDPKGDPTPIAESEPMEIRRAGNKFIDGQPNGIYTVEDRDDSRPKVTVELWPEDRVGGQSDD